MPILKGNLQADGALVAVRVGWGSTAIRRLRTALRPVPPPTIIRAVLDTGADVTCLDPTVIATLGLPLAGFVPANVPATGGLTFLMQYKVNLTIVHPSGNPAHDLARKDWPIAEVPLTRFGYQALIGRDILSACRFLYDGPRGRFLLGY